jgi:hypothetical protein
MSVKSYEVLIPVYKKGDDMHHCVTSTTSGHEAFKLQASYYEMAAEVCKRMASFLYENPDVAIETTDCHVVTVSGPEEKCDVLVKDEVLFKDPFGEDEEDEEIPNINTASNNESIESLLSKLLLLKNTL